MAHISIKHNYFIIISLYYGKEQKNVNDDQAENGDVIFTLNKWSNRNATKEIGRKCVVLALN